MIQKLENYFFSKKLFYLIFGYIFLNEYSFKKVKSIEIDMFWGKAICSSEIKVPINNIYGNIKTESGFEKRDLIDTPHYEYLCKSLPKRNIEYKKYIKNHFSEYDSDKKVKEYENLVQKVLKNPDNFFVLIKKDLNSFKNKEVKIIDGLHRATILKKIGVNSIKCLIIDEIILN